MTLSEMTIQTCTILVRTMKARVKGLEHRKDLGDNYDFFPVVSIRNYAGNRGNEEGGDLSGKTGESEKEGGICQSINQPADGDALHPGAGEGNPLTYKEKAVVAIFERPEGMFGSAGEI